MLFVVVSAAVDGGKLMGYFNLPWFAWGSAEMNLGDTVEYNTLVRVTSPVSYTHLTLPTILRV